MFLFVQQGSKMSKSLFVLNVLFAEVLETPSSPFEPSVFADLIGSNKG